MRFKRLLPYYLLLSVAVPGCGNDPGDQLDTANAIRERGDQLGAASAIRVRGDQLGIVSAVRERAAQPRLVRGAAAITLLDDDRRKILASLQQQSDTPIEIVLDAKTRTVVSISGHIATRGDTVQERARTFVDLFQGLVEPIVPSQDYMLANQDPSCYDSTVVFDRTVKDTVVVGSRLTVHFDDSHAIESVTNGVAPVPSQIVDIDPTRIDGAHALSDLLPLGDEVKPTRTQVFVPAPDLSGVVAADLVSWNETAVKGQVTPVAAVAIGDIAITGKLKVATSIAVAPPLTKYGPQYFDKDGLPLPEFISYRSLGGVSVNHFPWESNPVEMAYRFLEEHPSLMRSGAARCQFAPRDVSEDSAAPGVYYVRIQQKYGPLPVFASELVIMQEGIGKVMSVAGRTLPKIEAATTPAISASDALDSAARTLIDGAAREPQYDATVRAALKNPARVALGVLPAHKQASSVATQERLAYEVQRGPYVFYVDAETAEPIASRSLIASANIVTDALGGNELGWPFVRDEVDGIPTGLVAPRNFDNLPGRPGGNTGASVAAVAGFYASLGWNSANNRGADWVANTNVAMTFTACQNAFFDGIITGQTFYCIGAAANDVVGHEFTHGVVAASSKLWFSDQSGALNEAYGDIMGNLMFPDTTSGGWFVGELTTGGTFRDMVNPTAFNGDPMHMSAFRSRDASCNLLPWSCDSGFVHSNAGIINRAHVLLSDGIPAPGGGLLTPGIGRLKMKLLIFRTMTARLFSDARFNDVPVATRDICEMFVARGVTVQPTTGAPIPFTLSDCDQVTAAFNQVGLDGRLDTGWQEPTLGFAGSHIFFGAGETTPGGCPVSNVVGDLSTISGNRSIDLDPTTALPTTTSFYFGTQSIALRVSPGPLPIPLGTTAMFHIIDWTNTFGVEPRYATRVDYPATCAPPINQITRVSPTFVSPNNLFGAGGTTFIGGPASSWGPGCALRDTLVELVDASGNTTAGPAHSVIDTVTHWVFNWPINFNMTATIALAPPGGPAGNLAAAVTWAYDVGRGPARIRLRYIIDQAVGSVCNP